MLFELNEIYFGYYPYNIYIRKLTLNMLMYYILEQFLRSEILSSRIASSKDLMLIGINELLFINSKNVFKSNSTYV